MKVAFVVQRYGMEVAGGSELFCRRIAERMSRHWDLEVLTTCAIDYESWRDHYAPGLSEVNGVKVRRFRVDHPRTRHFFDHIFQTIFPEGGTPELHERWAREQGPYSSNFIRYLEEHGKEYDLFVFFTYLYGLTYFGLPLVHDRSVLVPTAHDEDPFKLEIFRKIFALPRGLLFLTPEERELVEARFGVTQPARLLGFGIDRPATVDPSLFREWARNRVPGRYLAYVGRIDPCKGCHELFAYFQAFRRRHPDQDLKLVLVGKPTMDIPEHPDIVNAGFLSDELKFSAIAGSTALVMPSPFESLSIVTLEAWSLGVPALVNSASPVLAGQVGRSGGGLLYRTPEEFDASLRRLLDSPELCQELGERGRRFVGEHYQWDRVEGDLMRWIREQVAISPSVS